MRESLLKSLSEGYHLSDEEFEYLYNQELANFEDARAFEMTGEDGPEKIKQRSQWFKEVYPPVKELCQQLGFQDLDRILSTLWRLWLPLAIQLAQAKAKKGSPYIVGILGGQGTGKTTLTKVINLILTHFHYKSFGLSIDDIYKTYQERKVLRKNQGLIWRGPPGTHDLEAGLQVLTQVLQSDHVKTILIPRFDKSLWDGEGDRIEPESVAGPVDIVMFEGWFVGVCPIDDAIFDSPLSPISAEDKPFARSCNQQLKDYLLLWEKLDYLIILHPVDYRLSKQWRKEAEHKMIAQGKKGMTDEEIEQFVEYFWKALHPELFITPLTQNSGYTNLVVEINWDHSLGRIYKPEDF